jgi:hypothetical protein
MEFCSATKQNEIFSFTDKWMDWRTSSLVQLVRLRRPKDKCSPSYMDDRHKTNTVILLDTGHTLRRDSAWEG